MLVLDFETKSCCDLLTAGTYNYVADPTTDILCCAFYDMNTHHKEIWYPSKGPLSKRLRYALKQADLVIAHYAEFDQGVYEWIAVERYGFPELPPERWYCSAAQCRVNAIPAGLDNAAWALGLAKRKHASGAHLIKKLSIPQADGTFNEDPQLHWEMREYCMQDVIVTVGVVQSSRMMTTQEHADWLKTCEINERGIKIDLELAEGALAYAKAEQDEIAAKLLRLTNGAVERHTQGERIKRWIVAQTGELGPLAREMTVYKNGVAKLSLDKGIRRNILNLDPNIAVPDDVIEVIQLTDDGNQSSVAKFKRMIERADTLDHRVRGAFVFAGASQTLRFASRGVQLHNIKRDCWTADETRLLLGCMQHKRLLSAPDGSPSSVMSILAKALRPAIIPAEGNVLVVGDWSSIEARCLHWGVDTLEGDMKLNLFERGEDVYMLAAQAMGFDDRQTGKVAELSCGYQGGYRALQKMARNYEVILDESTATLVVERWRETNWWVVQFWAQMEQAARSAINHPGQFFEAGVVKYVYVPALMDGTLMCIMPGDNIIQYPKARIEEVTMPWGDTGLSITAMKAAFKPKADSKEWPRTALYGGLLTENFCQGFAAALLRNALRKLPDVIAHVHDEIVLEVPKADAEKGAVMLQSAMLDVPEWAAGLPLDAEPKIMSRYGK